MIAITIINDYTNEKIREDNDFGYTRAGDRGNGRTTD